MKSYIIDCFSIIFTIVIPDSFLKKEYIHGKKYYELLCECSLRSNLKNLLGRLSLEELVKAYKARAFGNIYLLQIVIEVLTKFKHRNDSRVMEMLQDYESKW